ncbi:MAG: ribonuclease P protein component [Candidatus Moranbacteria bacterium]|nr:ribonuclease P protein component [Candidatus Moranbacteria bacterium]
MLPSALRLKNPLSFQKAFRFGRAFFFGNVGCRIVFSAKSGRKFGFLSAKKMFRLSVERNRARRILSEAVAPVASSFPEDAHIVLFFRSKPEHLEMGAVRHDLDGLINAICASTRRN